jgi:hypothetical protein
MISSKCFTTEWIEKKSVELKYKDKNLIEKVIRAMSLLDMLASSGCPFYFKGGSCLMLLLHDGTHRLSIDIDVMCPPGTDIEKYLKYYADSGFIHYQMIERKQTTANVPKSHSKFFYKVAFRSDSDKTSFILLDVLYEDCHYQQVNRVPILHDLIESEGAPLMVAVPSIGDILGDKLTAFAPETSGIPYYKKGQLASLEIIKQLYDIARLADRVSDLTTTISSFQKIAAVELGYRSLPNDLKLVYDDIRQTALNISTRGYFDKDKFALLQLGINNIRPFMYKGNYLIEQAVADAAKAAYIATLIEYGITNVEHYDGNPASLIGLTLSPRLHTKLNKLKMNNPEAFFYWAKLGEVYDSKLEE